MWNVIKTYGYEVWNEDGLVGVSGFLRQEGNMLIFSDFEIDTIKVRAIRRGW